MTEKASLLPTEPDNEPTLGGPSSVLHPPPTYDAINMPKMILAPGLEFDPARKYRYGLHAVTAAGLIFLSYLLIELRSCNWGPGIDLDRLQALHVALMIFTFAVYLLSLFGIAEFLSQYKCLFSLTLLLMYAAVGLMFWMTYEAAVNPCVRTYSIPIDLDLSENKNVFNRGDYVGMAVLLLDISATLFTISAACSFLKKL